MLCFICQKKHMMEELRVSSFSCLAIRHLITLAYIATYLCAFWTVLPGICPFTLYSQVDITFHVTHCAKRQLMSPDLISMFSVIIKGPWMSQIVSL